MRNSLVILSAAFALSVAIASCSPASTSFGPAKSIAGRQSLTYGAIVTVTNAYSGSVSVVEGADAGCDGPPLSPASFELPAYTQQAMIGTLSPSCSSAPIRATAKNVEGWHCVWVVSYTPGSPIVTASVALDQSEVTCGATFIQGSWQLTYAKKGGH